MSGDLSCVARRVARRCLRAVSRRLRAALILAAAGAASVYVVTALSDLLVASNKAGLSARAVARKARESGYSLNHDTAARYLRGDHGVPDEATLIALSDIFGVSMRELRKAADLPSETTAPYVPPAEASRLTRRQRKALDEIIRSMVEPTRTRAAAGDELSARRAAPRRQAARRGRPEPPTDD
jgi:transcriptional regulator with XRE-family HTH domain